MPEDGAIMTDTLTSEQQLVVDGETAINELEEALAVANLKLNDVMQITHAYRQEKGYPRARRGVIKVDRCIRKVREMLDGADEATVGLHAAMAGGADHDDVSAGIGGTDK